MTTEDELFGPLDAAVYATVHEFNDPRARKRGSVALAPRIGMPAGTLSNKANPLMPDHKLGLAEAVAIMLTTEDFRILHAANQLTGHCSYRLPLHADAGDVEILDAYAAAHEMTGAKAAAIREALRDGRVTQEEIEQVRACFDKEVRAGLELMSRLEALAR